MANPIKTAFEPQVVPIDIDRLQLLLEFDPRERRHQKYKQIQASIRAIGVIEPLVVFPLGRGDYRVLDGRKRLDILREGKLTKQVECLIAKEDEAYSYNRRVNYLSPVGEHQMILRALAHNTENRIAEALNVDVGTIRRKLNLLTGVCQEAVDILKDYRISAKAFAVLKKMKPVRQVEVAQLMVASKMYSGRFLRALLAGTRQEMLRQPEKEESKLVDTREQEQHLQLETDRILRDLKEVEESYGREVLTLDLSAKYVSRLVANQEVRSAIQARHPELLQALESLLETMESESRIAVKPESRRQRSRARNAGAA